ncbi:hypothetical protein [Arthrobacter sp. D2-10]
MPDKDSSIVHKLRKWTAADSTCSSPSISSLLEVAQIIDYPLVEQLVDLGYVAPDDLDLIDSPLLTPGWLLMQRLERALSETRRTASGVAELISALRAHTIRTSTSTVEDLARWRARVFDIPVGTKKYRHIGYHAVEFEVWLGPTPEASWDRRLAERERRGNATVCRLIPSASAREKLLKRHLGNREPSTEVMAGAYERVELEHRMEIPRAEGHFNVYGLDGKLAAPLVGDSRPGPRHIYVESASVKTDLRESRPQSPDIDLFEYVNGSGQKAWAKKILFIAPPAASPVPTAHLIGRALGWNVISLRQSAGSVTGSLVRIRDQESARQSIERASRAFRTASGTESPTLFVGTYLQSLANSEEGKRLLLDESLLPVLLIPTWSTLQYWVARQRVGQGLINPKAAEDTEKVLNQIEETVRQREFGNGEVFQFSRDMEWWPTRGRNAPEKFADSADFFEHPVIGDIRLKAAYQLAYLFTNGRLPVRPANTYFLNGPVAQFHDSLKLDGDRPLRRKPRGNQSQNRTSNLDGMSAT